MRRLPRHDPPREANRVNHGIVAGEPGHRKRSRRVREGGVGEGPSRAPRRRRTSTQHRPRRPDRGPEPDARAWQAQVRLHRRYHHLTVERGKRSTVATVAVARELAGFLWAAATHQPFTVEAAA